MPRILDFRRPVKSKQGGIPNTPPNARVNRARPPSTTQTRLAALVQQLEDILASIGEIDLDDADFLLDQESRNEAHSKARRKRFKTLRVIAKMLQGVSDAGKQ